MDDAGPVDAGPPFQTRLESADELGALSLDPEGLDAVKYVAPIAGAPRGALEADCYFQNMRVYPWHLQFLRTFSSYAQLDYQGYLSLVLRPATRRLWGGSVQRWPHTPHPEREAPGVISYTVYAEAGTLEAGGVVELDQRLKGCLPFARAELVYVPEDPAQEALVEREAAALRAEGVVVLDPGALH